MANAFPTLRSLRTDGTSQQARHLEALDPASAPLDERTLLDDLGELKALADELRWHDEHGKAIDTWRLLFDPTNDLPVSASEGSRAERESRVTHHLERLAAYAEDPSTLAPALARQLSPPHVTLLLVALKLLQRARRQLNGLTARHLDYYYREVLGYRPRPPAPDRVYVLVTPARGRQQARLPSNSLLSAGQDAKGRERLYATERELAVNRVQVAALRSLYADVRVTDPATVRREHPREDRLLDLLRLAIGHPHPGDALPSPPVAGWPDPDEELFTNIFKEWVDFSREALHLELFELRELAQLKRSRDDDDGDWSVINTGLNAIGKRRAGADFDLAVRLGAAFDPRAFTRNLAEALGEEPDFGGLSEVETIDDLFKLRDRDEVREFMRTPPYDALTVAATDGDLPEFADDFIMMMMRKQLIDTHWQLINDHLSRAGQNQRSDPSFSVERRDHFEASAFDDNLTFALPALDFSTLPPIGTQLPATSITEYMDVIGQMEAYMSLSAESIRFLLNEAFPKLGAAPDRALWARADAILAEARRAKSIEQRRADLQRVRAGAAGSEEALRAVLAVALGTESEPLPKLEELLDTALAQLDGERDRAILREFAERVVGVSMPDEEWNALISVAERLQRARLSEETAPLERRTWLDLYRYDDATQVAARTSPAAEPAQHSWRTFGGAPPQASSQHPPPPILGWGIASPVLAMRQGLRRITLSLEFDGEGLTPAHVAAATAEFAHGAPLQVQVTSPGGWMTAQDTAISSLTDSSVSGMGRRLLLQIDLDFTAASPPITPPTGEVELSSHCPVLRVMLRSYWDDTLQRFRNPYPALRRLRLLAMDCRVRVGAAKGGIDAAEAGLLEPTLRNDQSIVDPNRPFEPFGSRPAVGSRLVIADAELATKRLTSLRFDLAWMGTPAAGFETHYKGYGTEINNKSLAARITAVDRRVPVTLSASMPLFSPQDVTQAHSLVVEGLEDVLGAPPPVLDARPHRDPARWPRYFHCELTPTDFQHHAYPGEAARAALNGEVLNPPYTPQLKTLGVSYTARSGWHGDGEQALDEGEALLHFHPFGYAEVRDSRSGSVPFLPAYDHAGELLIGLAGVKAPQRVTVLLQMVEGSADPDLAPASVTWSYLDGERWVTLDEGKVRRDGTRGLINSGIVEFDLPKAASGTLLSREHYWLRAATQGSPRSLCDTVAIATQAVSAVFVEDDNDPSHYRQPLPAHSIRRPLRPINGIGAISQPYTSFGARVRESEAALRTRAAERLRHRNRALTPWDYEHLVLERFPQLHKVKCITANDTGTRFGAELGVVRLVVIPNVARQLPSDPFAPKASVGLLAEIGEFVRERSPLGAEVRVENAVFVPVKVRVSVQFHPEVDVELARKELHQSLNRHLSPWAFAEAGDIVIGGAIYANSIIAFLERQQSVDYVQQPKLFRFDADSGDFLLQPYPTMQDSDGYRVSAAYPDEVLVAAASHEIDIIRPGVSDVEELTGIGYMKVGLDFVVDVPPTTE